MLGHELIHVHVVQVVAEYDRVLASGLYAERVPRKQRQRWIELKWVGGWYMDIVKERHPSWPDDPLLWRPMAASVMHREWRDMRVQKPRMPVGVMAPVRLRQYLAWVWEERKTWSAKQNPASEGREMDDGAARCGPVHAGV